MSTPSIPGVDRDALAAALHRSTVPGSPPARIADVVLSYIADHLEPRACTCGAKYDRCPDCAADDGYAAGRKDAAGDIERADEWVEVDMDTFYNLPDGVQVRKEWLVGAITAARRLVHRDDLPDEGDER